MSTKSALQAENSTFFWRGHGQKYRSECTKTRHFKFKKIILGREICGGGIAPSPDPFPRWEVVLHPTLHLQLASWICRASPENSSQIYAIAESLASDQSLQYHVIRVHAR